MVKRLPILLTTAMMLASSGNFAKNLDAAIRQNTKKQAVKVLEIDTNTDWNDKTDLSSFQGKEQSHDSIINMPVKDIIALYGQEVGMNIIQQHLLIEINNFRQENNMTSLLVNPTLTGCAQKYAERIDSLDYAHKVINEKGKWHIDMITGEDPAQRAENAGFPTDIVGEIITYTPNTSSIHQAMNNRKESPSHRETLLSGSYNVVGKGGYKKDYWVVNFGNSIKTIGSLMQ